jgi:SAM-dependent methyltransferase
VTIPTPPAGPSSWLVDHLDLLPRNGTMLDVASGGGRHTLFLARLGFRMHAIDRNPEAIETLQGKARALGVTVTCEVMDLETDPPPSLGHARYDAVLVFNYLHRPLFPALRGALTAGGRLFYETFTTAQAACGHPKNRAFLLDPGELPALAAPLVVVRSREGHVDDRWVASIVAERRD